MIEQIQQAEESDEVRRKAKREQAAIGDGDQLPSWREVFLYFLMLGFVNIGGPVAQITMMYNHMVERRHIGRASIRSVLLATLLIGAFVGMRQAH